MISTFPRSSAACSAPSAAASKKPMPSALTTSAMRTGSSWALAAPAIVKAASAVPPNNLRVKLMWFLPGERLPVRSSAGPLFCRGAVARHDQPYLRGLQHRRRTVRDAVVGDDDIDPVERAQN